MAEKKSILEEALLDVKKIQEALNANTKEILRSVAKEEIDSVVKESLLKEDDFEEEDLESTDDADLNLEPVATGAEGGEAELGEPESAEGDLGDIEGSEEVVPAMEPELGMDASALGGDEMDMTAASDDDVIAIYKKLSGEDEIEIVGDEIHLNISEPGEYVVKTNDKASIGGEANSDLGGEDLVPVTGGEEEAGEEGGIDYDIELDGEEGGEEDLVPVTGDEENGEELGGEEPEEEQITELIATSHAAQLKAGGNLTATKGPGAKQAVKNESVKTNSNLISETTIKYNKLLAESNVLKTQNTEFKEALKKFRNMLVETVVFNSNLTYVTKLFMDHSTTKQEKKSIMERFDNEVSNLKDSKKLYRAIASELTSRKPITESIENKIIKEVASGNSKQLNESTAYVDPSTKRIMDLINRVEKR